MLGSQWDHQVDVALRKVEDYVNVLLERQFDQLADSLRDFLYDLFNYPLERPWRESLAIFAHHWEERGLKLTPRTLEAIGRLIAEELDGAASFEAKELDASASDGPAEIYLAAMPGRRPRGSGRQTPKGAPKGSSKAKPPEAFPHGKRLPAGKWIKGTEGNGVFKLAEAIQLSTGEIVEEIEYRNGLPIFDKWALKGEDVIVAITGENRFDQGEARKAWRGATGGTEPKLGYIFHHDGLTTHIGEYESRKVFAGRMQLIPRELNELPHIGSGKIAREFTLDPVVAKEVNRLALKGKGPLTAMRKRIVSQLAKQAKRLGKAIPIIGGAITLIFFAEDVEAHGVGGAIVRATPLLGDLVNAYDLGTELAAQIREDAKKKLEAAYAEANLPVRAAHVAAMQHTSAAFNQLAKSIRVTRQYIQPEQVVDAVKEPLNEFYGEVHLIHAKMLRGQIDLDALPLRLQRAKETLERNLRNNLEKPPSAGQEPLS